MVRPRGVFMGMPWGNYCRWGVLARERRAEGEHVAVGVAGDEVAKAVRFVGGFEEDGCAAFFDGGTVVVDLFGDDDNGSAADGSAPDGVGAEMQLELAEEDAGVVAVAEVDGESEDIPVEGDGNFDVGDLEDGGGAGGLHEGKYIGGTFMGDGDRRAGGCRAGRRRGAGRAGWWRRDA